jgi:hypothetical protein
VAGSFFRLLKRERIKQNICTTKQDFHSDVFDRIEVIYNPQHLHDLNNLLSSVEFEKHYMMRQGVSGKSGGIPCIVFEVGMSTRLRRIVRFMKWRKGE